MTLYEELQQRGLIAQVTNEEEIKKMQKDNLVLKEEEDKHNKELQDIQNKYNKKCNEFKKILGELDSYQNNIDSLLK